MSEDIGVYSCGRLTSQRCKNKMIREFGDTSLTDIFLSKLKLIGNNTFAGCDQILKTSVSNMESNSFRGPRNQVIRKWP